MLIPSFALLEASEMVSKNQELEGGWQTEKYKQVCLRLGILISSRWGCEE